MYGKPKSHGIDTISEIICHKDFLQCYHCILCKKKGILKSCSYIIVSI